MSLIDADGDDRRRAVSELRRPGRGRRTGSATPPRSRPAPGTRSRPSPPVSTPPTADRSPGTTPTRSSRSSGRRTGWTSPSRSPGCARRRCARRRTSRPRPAACGASAATCAGWSAASSRCTRATADPVAGLVENPDGGRRSWTSAGTSRTGSAASCRGIRADEARTFHYLHILLPHVPWRYLPSGAQYDFPDNDPGKVDDEWIDQAWPPQLARERHLLQLRYVDGLVGDLLARLRDTGIELPASGLRKVVFK